MSITMSRKLEEVSLTSIRPAGWLRSYLKRQSRGLTGHMEVAGFPFDTKGWACAKVPQKRGEPWWPYEQTGYWVDGMTRCGYLLSDKRLIDKAKKSIDYVLKHADADAYLGPKHLKKAEHWSRWAHAVFFRAMMAHYSATGDKRVLKALTKHYIQEDLKHCGGRDICNIEIMLWVYSKTGNKRLLDQAERAYAKYNKLCANDDTSMANMLSGKKATEHGVTYNEIGKLGAILYMYTGKKKYLAATENAYRKIDKYHMLIDGVCSSSEQLRGKDPLDSHETCDIADYTWSVGYLLLATGEAEYADKIERACFNAAPGAVTEDFRALQYFSCPNQVIADKSSNHSLWERGNSAMSYRPNPYTECCPGEVNRIMPNFAARMWLRNDADGITAALYGPSQATAKLGGQKVTIIERTDYPFSERIYFEIQTKGSARFSLGLRIPGWCRKAKIIINGKERRGKLKAGSFIKIRRNFRNKDVISLILPMELKLSHWPGGGAALERGPLVYSLGIEEDRRIDKRDRRSSKEFPAWNMYPASRWNYALDLNGRNLNKAVEVVKGSVGENPWSMKSAPIQLRVPARRVRNWKISNRRSVLREVVPGKAAEKHSGEFAFTPALPEPSTLARRLSKKTETITLVPYGCTNLRLTIFPKINRRKLV